MKNVPIFLIILFCLFLWGGQYVFRHLWEPDEARYTYVAWEMNERGDWFVPYRNGVPYPDKPPLMFWLIKASTFLTGGRFNQISGRLPTLLGAIFALWAMTRIVALFYDPATAWRSFFIVCTSFLFWHKGGTGQIDMILLGLELVGLYMLFKSDYDPAWWRSVLAFIFMGMAILAKGPVGLIIPVGIYLTANIVSGQGRVILRPHWIWGIPLALMLPGIWLLAAKSTGAPSAYFNELLFDQNIGRAAGDFGGHVKPFYYYLKYLPIDFLPWTFFIPASLVIAYKDHAGLNSLKKMLGWIFFVVVFFSLCTGKRNLYILSVYPAAAVIIAATMPKMGSMAKKWQAGTSVPLMLVLMILAIALLITPFIPNLPVATYPLVITGIVLLAGTLGLFFLFRQSGLNIKWFSAFISFVIGLEILVGVLVFPAFNRIKTPVLLAEAAARIIPENDPLLLYQINGEILSLNSHRRGLRIKDEQSLTQEMIKNGKGIVVFREKTWNLIKPRFIKWGHIQLFKMGGKKLIWLEYDVSKISNIENPI